MPQGAKPPKAKTSTNAKSRITPSNRKQLGPSAKAPRDARVAKRRKDAKRSAAGLTTAMEQRLAERAGHTEMVGGKDGKGGARREQGGADKDKAKGGKKGGK